MSGFIGYVDKEGVFLSADSRRTNLVDGSVSIVKKIHKLNNNMIVATGGYGTLGHECREELNNKIIKTSSIEDVFDIAKPIFKNAYSEFILEHQDHIEHLYLIVGGYSINKNEWVLGSLRSVDNFESVFWINRGRPYFTGSNTNLVIKIASDEFYKQKASEITYKLDIWAFKSFKALSKVDVHIGFPIQLCILNSDSFVEVEIESENSNVESDSRFLAEFPI
jgi:predicted proteasome-type protease